ncbi:flagellar biosynthetic protein FliR [Cognatishimia sp. WU-CL00825]|uniref:flagellar biosynthetic protein FliR n=1 Tax=Cognatishimia sp. WU-CL00825 TaxID=3127658 RepID=UPI00310C5051
MTDSLQQIWPLIDRQFWLWATVFLRVAAASSLMPGFGESAVPLRVKLAMAVALTLAVTPALPTETPAHGLPLFTTILRETTIGLVLGLGLRAFVFTLQTAGAIAANVTSLSQLFNNGSAEQLPIIGHALNIAGLTLIFVTGLHITFVEYLLSSYSIFPLGAFPDRSTLTPWGVEQVARSFQFAFQLAAPFVILSLLYNVTLGIVNRAMPQLMVALVGAPFITGASLVLLMITAPFLLSVWLARFTLFLSNPF